MNTMAKKTYELKVDKSIKPLKVEERKPFDLIIGEKYYVSFGMNRARPCKLLWCSDEVRNGFPLKISIDLLDGTTNSAFGDEIGRTPEEAVQHEVTF